MSGSRRKKTPSISRNTPAVVSVAPPVSLKYHRSVQSELDALPDKHAGQVIQKISGLKGDPYPPDRRNMTDMSGVYRIDSGEYRIAFTETKTATQHVITIVMVDRRNDKTIYNRLKRRMGL